MINERNQTQKTAYSVISFIRDSRKDKTAMIKSNPAISVCER